MPASDSGFHFIQDYQRCPRYWYNKYVRGLEEIRKSPALIFGESGHEALEHYYRLVQNKVPFHERVEPTKQTFLNALKERKDQYEYHDRFEDDINRAEAIIDAYALQHSMEYLSPIAIEESLEMELPNGQVFTGRIDLVVKSQEGAIYIMDHKFTGWSLSSFAKTTENSDQATAYLMLWNQTHPELEARGVIFNIIREYKGNVNFLRPIVTKTDGDIENFKLDLMDIQNEIVHKLGTPDARWPKNTGSCFLFNRPCPFINICKGENFEYLIGSKYKLREEESETGDAV